VSDTRYSRRTPDWRACESLWWLKADKAGSNPILPRGIMKKIDWTMVVLIIIDMILLTTVCWLFLYPLG